MTKGIFVAHGRLQVEFAVLSRSGDPAKHELKQHPVIRHLLAILSACAEVSTSTGAKFVPRRLFTALSVSIHAALSQAPSVQASEATDRALQTTDWALLKRWGLDGEDKDNNFDATTTEAAELGFPEVASPRQLNGLLFELVHVWCSTVDPNEYISFIVSLLDSIVLVDEDETISLIDADHVKALHSTYSEEGFAHPAMQGWDLAEDPSLAQKDGQIPKRYLLEAMQQDLDQAIKKRNERQRAARKKKEEPRGKTEAVAPKAPPKPPRASKKAESKKQADSPKKQVDQHSFPPPEAQPEPSPCPSLPVSPDGLSPGPLMGRGERRFPPRPDHVGRSTQHLPHPPQTAPVLEPAARTLSPKSMNYADNWLKTPTPPRPQVNSYLQRRPATTQHAKQRAVHSQEGSRKGNHTSQGQRQGTPRQELNIQTLNAMSAGRRQLDGPRVAHSRVFHSISQFQNNDIEVVWNSRGRQRRKPQTARHHDAPAKGHRSSKGQTDVLFDTEVWAENAARRAATVRELNPSLEEKIQSLRLDDGHRRLGCIIERGPHDGPPPLASDGCISVYRGFGHYDNPATLGRGERGGGRPPSALSWGQPPVQQTSTRPTHSRRGLGTTRKTTSSKSSREAVVDAARCRDRAALRTLSARRRSINHCLVIEEAKLSIEEVFKTHDRLPGGMNEMTNMQSALHSLGLVYTDPKEIQKILRIADDNQDGDVSLSEFSFLVTHFSSGQGKRALDQEIRHENRREQMGFSSPRESKMNDIQEAANRRMSNGSLEL